MAAECNVDIPTVSTENESVDSQSESNIVCSVSSDKKRARSGDNSEGDDECLKRQKKESSTDEMAELKMIMFDLATEVKSLNDRVFERIGSLEKVFARNLAENMTKMVDIKIRKEIDKVKEDFGSEIGTVNKRIDGLVNKVREDIKSVKNELAKKPTYAEAADSHRDKGSNKIVIKMLEEREGERNDPESVKHRVVSLIRDGLHLTDVKVTAAERASGNGGGKYPRVITAEVETKEQKEKVLKNKMNLRNTRNYRKVYIEDVLSKEARTNQANMRTLLKELGRDRDLVVRNGKLQKRGDGRAPRTDPRDDRASDGGRNGQWQRQGRPAYGGSRGGRR